MRVSLRVRRMEWQSEFSDATRPVRFERRVKCQYNNRKILFLTQ